jgi:hypothetical protein
MNVRNIFWILGVMFFLQGCEKPTLQTKRFSTIAYDINFAKVTISGLNQFKEMPTVIIEDRDKIYQLVACIGDELPGPAVDYNEKYRIVFACRDGKEVIIRTLYTDRHWHYEGTAEDHPMKEGFAEYMNTLLHQK